MSCRALSPALGFDFFKHFSGFTQHKNHKPAGLLLDDEQGNSDHSRHNVANLHDTCSSNSRQSAGACLQRQCGSQCSPRPPAKSPQTTYGMGETALPTNRRRGTVWLS